jgi:beta-galactosidase/beta-glucuronidase
LHIDRRIYFLFRRRTAHNPVNSELLDHMDKVGMLVWSENRNLERQVIGSARRGSAPQSSQQARVSGFGQVIDTTTFPDPMYLADAAAMVLRDRNHPSIISAC